MASPAARQCFRRTIYRVTGNPNVLCTMKEIRNYTVAITREVPESLAKGLSMHHQNAFLDISVDRAKKQHSVYLNHLRCILPTMSLPSLEHHPDCVFVEDTAVAIGRNAVINRIGHESRRGEVDDMKETLVSFGVKVTDMRDINEEATCDGGDVLFVEGAKCLFVGLSSRTNQEGIAVLQRVFEPSGIKVVAVPSVTHEALHLKSIVTCLDEMTLVAPKGPLGNEVLRAMEVDKLSLLNTVRLPNVAACNLVSVNGCVLAQETTCSETKMLLERESRARRLRLQYVDTSEFAKIDGTNATNESWSCWGTLFLVNFH